MKKDNLLSVKELVTKFKTDRGFVTAVDGVSFDVEEGEILGLVGESGCGKSATSQSIMRLYDEKFSVKYEGKIEFEGKNLLELTNSEMQKIRGNKISMIFQDPLSSLNPTLSIGFQIMETLLLHQNISKKEAYSKAIELLKLTGIPEPELRMSEYPHQLSGGMQQRVMIAMALSCQPKLLIADEPTTALDVTIQSQILDLIVNLNKKFNMSVIFITHDLGVVAEICDRVIVMYLGQIVEEADVNSLFFNPLHPYTKGLIKSIPTMDGDKQKDLYSIKGTVPSLDKIPKGCRFANRCPYADELCREKMPTLRKFNNNQKARCWHVEKISDKEVKNIAVNK